jgi:CxxC motif-containing protein (DUF1111 family)
MARHPNCIISIHHALRAIPVFVAFPLMGCVGMPEDEGPTVSEVDLVRSHPGVVTRSGFGLPLAGVAAKQEDLEIFAAGQEEFTEIQVLTNQGPLFNARSCGGCHFQPALGGSGQTINEVRVRNNTRPGPVQIFASDNMLRLGAQTQGGETIFPNGVEATPLGCQLTHENCVRSTCQDELAAATTFATTLPICDPTNDAFAAGDNCSAERQSTPLFGFGLIEAVADATFDAIAANQPDAIKGIVKRVTELGAIRVARFGWKSDIATLRGFSGDAYQNEMGITNPDFPTELSNCAVNQTQFGVLLDTDDDPEDTTDDTGRADTDLFADFMRALAPAPTIQQSKSAKNGRSIFQNIGCAGCHVENITTAKNPASFIPTTTGGVPITASLNKTLSNVTFHPFSDFLLHDMGSLGDGITSGAAGPTMMRTAPLWGLRGKGRFLHDGRAEEPQEAIELHDGQAAPARDAFDALTDDQKQNVLDFLSTI